MTRTIGVFDSGIGGLTVYAALHRQFPHARIVYLGDTARVPYGTKSAHTIIRYSLDNARFLLRRGVDMIVVACNTSSAVSIPALEKELSVPVLGVILPGAAAAVAKSRSGRIGVIGTEATIRSQAYLHALKSRDHAVKVFMQACPLFVPLVEEGWLTHNVTRLVAEEYLRGMRDHAVDTLVLGCTHYPLLKPVIAAAMAGSVEIVDSAEAVAAEAAKILNSAGESASVGASEFFVTDSTERFKRVAELFLGKLKGPVEEVDVQRD